MIWKAENVAVGLLHNVGFTAPAPVYGGGDWRASRAPVKARVRTRDLADVSVHPLVCDLTNSPVRRVVSHDLQAREESTKLTNATYKYLKREHFESLG